MGGEPGVVHAAFTVFSFAEDGDRGYEHRDGSDGMQVQSLL